MAYSVNASWEAPPPSQLNFSLCAPVADFTANLYLNFADNDTQSPYLHVPADTAIKFVQSIVPDNWTAPTDAEALLWYTAIWDRDYQYNTTELIDFAVITCGSAICPYLKWDGDADLSGIGMMISYYIAAVFVTIYYVVLAPGLCHVFGHSFGLSWDRYSQLAVGFDGSLQHFLDAMLLFTISMLVAAATRYGAVIKHPDETYSLFHLLDCVVLSTFSVFPAFVLQSLSHELRRRRIRLFLWFLVLAFVVAVDVLYNQHYLSIFSNEASLEGFANQDAEAAQTVWLAECQNEALLEALLAALRAGHVLMILNCLWLVYYVAASLGARRFRPVAEARAPRLWRFWQGMRLWLRLGNGLVCLAVMWAFLGLFTAYRQDVADRAAGTDQDNEWTFGQVLALLTWAPVGIDLVVIYIYGAKEGLSGSLSRKYKVVNRSSQEVLRDGVGYKQARSNDQNLAQEDLFETRKWPQPLERSESWLDA